MKIRLIGMAKIPPKRGLYILYNSNKDMIYIGISDNMLRRVKQHNEKPVHRDSIFGRVYYNDVVAKFCYCTRIDDLRTLHHMEKILIHIFNPPFNGHMSDTSKQKRLFNFGRKT